MKKDMLQATPGNGSASPDKNRDNKFYSNFYYGNKYYYFLMIGSMGRQKF
jgi:hypothetical protein